MNITMLKHTLLFSAIPNQAVFLQVTEEGCSLEMPDSYFTYIRLFVCNRLVPAGCHHNNNC